MIKCKECEKQNEYKFDVSQVNVNVEKKDSVIEITPEISIELGYPTYSSISETNFEGNEMEVGFDLAVSCIKRIMTEEELIESSDVPKQELIEFVESMSQEQFKNITDFLQAMPSMQHVANFTCEHCGEENELVLRGMQDFLS